MKKVLSVDKLEIAKTIEEIKVSINELNDKSIPLFSIDPSINSHANNNNILYPKQQASLEIKTAGISDYLSKDENEKVGHLQTMKHDKNEVEKVLNHFSEDLSCVSDFHRLGTWKPVENDQRPRPLLLSLTNTRTVRKSCPEHTRMTDLIKQNIVKFMLVKRSLKMNKTSKRNAYT